MDRGGRCPRGHDLSADSSRTAKCVRHAQCYATAPTLFPIGDSDYSTVDEHVVIPGNGATARDEVAAYPELALVIEVDDRLDRLGPRPRPTNQEIM